MSWNPKGPVPVEHKSRNAPRARPYDGDGIQAMTYCVLENWLTPARAQIPPAVRREWRYVGNGRHEDNPWHDLRVVDRFKRRVFF